MEINSQHFDSRIEALQQNKQHTSKVFAFLFIHGAERKRLLQ